MNDNKKGTNGLKVISVILAVLLWLFVTNENVIITKKQINGVKLDNVNLEEGLQATYTNSISVEIIGTPKKAADIDAYIDLKGLKPGMHTVPVKVGSVKGARITEIRPDQVKVQIFETRENVFPITYRVQKPPRADFRIEGIVIVPDKGLVKGPKELVNQVSSLLVFLDLGGRTDTTSFYAPVKAVDGQGQVLTENLILVPEQVQVYAVLGQEKDLRKVPVAPAFSGELAEGLTLGEIRVEPAKVDLISSGTRANNLIEVATEPISLQGRSESFSQEVDIVSPGGVEVFPTRVRVYVQINTTRQEADI